MKEFAGLWWILFTGVKDVNLGHLEYSQLMGQNGQVLLRSSKTVLCESGILKFEYKELISLKLCN